jgi:ATP/maltotriose-dependent transcriptional regulator MalT/DNA-binding SARP family transcriptional activator
MQASLVDPIDTHRLDFLSFPPVGDLRLGMEEAWLSVETEPGDDVTVAGEIPLPRSAFPLRPGKVQKPVLPAETLRRDRLLEWLGDRSACRLIFVTAEAGFGKTTLIADYLRRTRLRTFWYRLDEDDTDGLVFLRYLVAACQQADPKLLARSAALLNETSLEPIRQDVVLDTLLGELQTLGDVPSALVLDDYHMIEHVASIPPVVERLIDRAPRTLAIIVAGRRGTGLPMAVMRARGELAELGHDELRFDETEVEQLFRETYRRPLDPDVLEELHARTDGWAASLQLVKTAVDGLSMAQVRSFVQELTAAEGDLYDFLAEEVVGDLDPELRAFLLRAALLEDMDPAITAVAGDVPPRLARMFLGRAERLGLLSRNDGSPGSWRAHPLVRDFLVARLELEVGAAEVQSLHRKLAAALEPQSWRLAARHWAAAGDGTEVRRVICAAVPAIIGSGDFGAAEDFIARFPDPEPNPWYDIIRSRQLAADGRYDESLALARRAAAIGESVAAHDPNFIAANALNHLHLGIQLHDQEMWRPAVIRLTGSGDEELIAIGRAAELLAESSDGGSLDALRLALTEAARLNQQRAHPRHQGISLVNLSLCATAQGNAKEAVDAGEASLRLLSTSGNSGDVAAARINTAKGLAHHGRRAEWLLHETEILFHQGWMEPVILSEVAELEAMYGDPAVAARVMKALPPERRDEVLNSFRRLVCARVCLLQGDLPGAQDLIAGIGPVSLAPGFTRAVASLRLQVAAMAGKRDSELLEACDLEAKLADGQQAWFWSKSIRLTKALASSSSELNAFIAALAPADAAYLSIQAELVLRRLAELESGTLEIVRCEAVARPERWRYAVRVLLVTDRRNPLETKRAAQILELVGDEDDVLLLRAIGKTKHLKMPEAGKTLVRRLAPKAYVDDLGRVSIRVGGRVVSGADIRRKVLSLLAYLLTRPQYTATREQVIDALWPEMEPEQGANSLNQTSYFLRQVFEPKTIDDLSAGYLNCRGDLIWLDKDLVSSRSSQCLQLITATRRDDSPELVTRLAEAYTGQFAADFMYDDWACAFRETLHAKYLDRIERSLHLDAQNGAFDRAISTAQLALSADPDADQIELCLLRLYRRTGAHAAAAEQYAHYATVMREQLGVEPPPLDSL